MAKVIKVFRERMHGMKRYNIGDQYPEKDQERVQYLTELGYLELNEPSTPSTPPTLEEFLGLSAFEQKDILSRFEIEGDDSNAEKREALYKQFLGVEGSDEDNVLDGGAGADGDSDA